MSIPADEMIMISALQHYVYCPRQFYIGHVEQYWKDNYFTADGKRLHDRVDLPGNHRESGRRVEYALPLSSRTYGITGVADAVEFTADSVMPVEYKRGREKPDNRDAVQLCAQVFCLEEMLKCSISRAGLFYFETRERVPVEIDEVLRTETAEAVAACRRILETGICEVPVYSKRCRGCSFLEYCMPPRKPFSAAEYLAGVLGE